MNRPVPARPDQTVPAEDATGDFALLLERVRAGEVVTITDHGVAIAELRPVEPRDLQRKPGVYDGIPTPDPPQGEHELSEWRAARKRVFNEWARISLAYPAQNLGKVTRDDIYDYLDE